MFEKITPGHGKRHVRKPIDDGKRSQHQYLDDGRMEVAKIVGISAELHAVGGAGVRRYATRQVHSR